MTLGTVITMGHYKYNTRKINSTVNMYYSKKLFACKVKINKKISQCSNFLSSSSNCRSDNIEEDEWVEHFLKLSSIFSFFKDLKKCTSIERKEYKRADDSDFKDVESEGSYSEVPVSKKNYHKIVRKMFEAYIYI